MDTQRLLDLYGEYGSITRAAKEYCKENKLSYNDSFRRRVSGIINRTVANPPKELKANVEALEGKIITALDENQELMDIEQYCETYGLDYESIHSWKLVTHSAGIPYYNIFWKKELLSESINADFITEIVQEHIKPVSIKTVESNSDVEYFDRLVLTDIHIGMDTGGGRNVQALYPQEWGEREILDRLSIVIEQVLKNKKGSVLYIDELGDYTDGLFGQTSRGGHGLPQNMDDKEMFRVGLKAKMYLLENLIPHYDKIHCHNIVESNHGPLLDYFINEAVKSIIELKYPERVSVTNYERFMNHYSVGAHTFILSHGKDSSSLKFGFKPNLDPAAIDKIDKYIKYNSLYDGKYIEFSKGDSHRGLMDFTGSNDFQYMNYPAFCPPSNWVGVNFGSSKSGFVFYNINYFDNEKIMHPYLF